MKLQILIDAARDASDQASYETAAHAVFSELDALDAQLADRRYLNGAEIGDLDWELYRVLLNFELVYYALYKLNRTRIRDFPNLGQYLLDLHQQAGDVDVVAMKRDAWLSDSRRNPKGVVPLGLPDLQAPHDRLRFDRAAVRQAGTEENHKGKKGEFVRGVSAHRRFIGRELPAEKGRYHLIIANNCPWCHRTALTRSMKGLQDVIGLGVLWYRRDAANGWQFRGDLPGFEPDALHGYRWVEDYYRSVGSTERSVPLLWDKATGTPVNNESAEIIRMFDDAWPESGPRLAPAELLPAIDDANAWIWRDINNGAYKAGFSSNQQVYEAAYHRLFSALDRLDRLLADQRWVCGDVVTEADVRLYPTIFRFDPVYYIRMKLDERMIGDYPNLSRWLADFGELPGVAEASDIEHCRQGYFGRTGDNLIPIG